MLVALIAAILGFVAMVPVIYISFVCKWKESTETLVGLTVFGVTMFVTAPYIAKLIL